MIQQCIQVHNLIGKLMVVSSSSMRLVHQGTWTSNLIFFFFQLNPHSNQHLNISLELFFSLWFLLEIDYCSLRCLANTLVSFFIAVKCGLLEASMNLLNRPNLNLISCLLVHKYLNEPIICLNKALYTKSYSLLFSNFTLVSISLMVKLHHAILNLFNLSLVYVFWCNTKLFVFVNSMLRN